MRIIEVKLLDQLSPPFRHFAEREGLSPLVCGFISLVVARRLSQLYPVTARKLVRFIRDELHPLLGDGVAACQCAMGCGDAHADAKRVVASSVGKGTSCEPTMKGKEVEGAAKTHRGAYRAEKRFIMHEEDGSILLQELVDFVKQYRSAYVLAHPDEFATKASRAHFCTTAMGVFEVAHVLRTMYGADRIAFLRAVWQRPSRLAMLEESQNFACERLYLHEEAHLANTRREAALEVTAALIPGQITRALGKILPSSSPVLANCRNHDNHCGRACEDDSGSSPCFSASTSFLPPRVMLPCHTKQGFSVRELGVVFDIPLSMHAEHVPQHTFPTGPHKDLSASIKEEEEEEQGLLVEGLESISFHYGSQDHGLKAKPCCVNTGSTGSRDEEGCEGHRERSEKRQLGSCSHPLPFPEVAGVPTIVDLLGHFNIAVPLARECVAHPPTAPQRAPRTTALQQCECLRALESWLGLDPPATDGDDNGGEEIVVVLDWLPGMQTEVQTQERAVSAGTHNSTSNVLTATSASSPPPSSQCQPLHSARQRYELVGRVSGMQTTDDQIERIVHLAC